MQINKIRTSPYHASCNGMLERYHRCFYSLLAKVVSADQRNGTDHLQTDAAAFRATTHEATKMTPNRVFLGREVRLPIDLVMGASRDAELRWSRVSEVANSIVDFMRRDGIFVRPQLG